MRTPLTLAASLAIAALLAARPAAAIETIDCTHDRSAAERTICSSAHLQILDAQVTEAYADIMHDSRVSPGTKSAVYESQLGFLAKRDSCGRDEECLEDIMQRRASRINFYR